MATVIVDNVDDGALERVRGELAKEGRSLETAVRDWIAEQARELPASRTGRVSLDRLRADLNDLRRSIAEDGRPLPELAGVIREMRSEE